MPRFVNPARGHRSRIEDEAPANDRFQQLVVPISQGLANFPDALGQRVVRHESTGPRGAKQVLLGDQPAVVFMEVDQYLERLGAQPDLAPAVQHAPAVDADHDIPHGYLS